MLAVAGDHPGGLLLSRDSHKSVVAGLIFGGIQPRWVTPQWDADRHISHPPSPEQVEKAWQRHPDAAGALVVSPSPYGTCADIKGIAEVCHRRDKPLIVDDYLRSGKAAGMGIPDATDPSLECFRVSDAG